MKWDCNGSDQFQCSFIHFLLENCQIGLEEKPLILFPMFGGVIDSLLYIVNYEFIESLPTEFIYVIVMYNVLGGMPCYYLGIYSYAADISSDKERSSRLARMDGIEMIGTLIGVLASPKVFQWLAYNGNYGFCFVLNLAAFLYIFFGVK